MKTIKIVLLGWGCAVALGAQAAVMWQTWTVNQTIPEGNPVGITFTGAFSAANAGDQVLGLTVGLTLSGGYNGNLYAYLLSPEGVKVVLMNQPGVSVNGFGASGSGMNITLTDAYTAQGAIQNVTSSSVLSGAYHPAEQFSYFGTSGTPGGLANGTWTLFFADLATGGGTSTLESWRVGMELSAVPEPSEWAALSLGLLGVVWVVKRRFMPARA